MVGRTLACIQGPATSASAWQTIVESITNHRECEVELTNYDKSRRPFRHVVRVVPIDGPSGSAAFVRATSRDVERLHDPGAGSRRLDASPQPKRVRTAEATPSPPPAKYQTKCGAAAPGWLAREESVDSALQGALAAQALPFDLPGVPSGSACHLASSGSHARMLSALALSEPAPVVVPMPLCPSLGGLDRGFSVVTRARAPYELVWASRGWLGLCGFEAVEIFGRTFHCIQGPATDSGTLALLMGAVRETRDLAGVGPLVNYDKSRRPFVHTLDLSVVRDQYGKPAYYRADSRGVQRLATASAPLEEGDLECQESWDEEMEAFLESWVRSPAGGGKGCGDAPKAAFAAPAAMDDPLVVASIESNR